LIFRSPFSLRLFLGGPFLCSKGAGPYGVLHPFPSFLLFAYVAGFPPVHRSSSPPPYFPKSRSATASLLSRTRPVSNVGPSPLLRAAQTQSIPVVSSSPAVRFFSSPCNFFQVKFPTDVFSSLGSVGSFCFTLSSGSRPVSSFESPGRRKSSEVVNPLQKFVMAFSRVPRYPSFTCFPFFR